MLLDEILMNLNESAEAEHPEDCECEECLAKKAAEEETVDECSESQTFWEETGIDEVEDKELADVNAKMRKLMAKRSQCVPGSAKQEKINDELDKIYDRRHELMSKKSSSEDDKGSEVLEALEDINSETSLEEGKELANNGNCKKALDLGEEEISEENPWAVENQVPEKRYMLDAETPSIEKIEYDEEPVDEEVSSENESANNAEAGAKLGASLGEKIGKGLDAAKEWGSKTFDKVKNELGKAHDALQKDAIESGIKESVYKVNKVDGSNEYILAESGEKFAEYLEEAFENIASFEKINTEKLYESMDHEVVDTIVSEFKNESKVSLADIQARVSEMVDDSMSEEFVKTIFNKILNTLKDAGIEVAE